MIGRLYRYEPAAEAFTASPSAAARPAMGTRTVSGFPVVLHRRAVVRLLATVIVVLTLLSLAGQIAKFVFGYPTVWGLVEFLYVDLENNLPTWYQSVALLLCAVLLAFCAIAARRGGAPFPRHWAALAGIFAFLSLDEMGSVHERAIDPMMRLVGSLPGVWQPLWVILGLVLVAVVALAFLRFFFHFATRERAQVFAAAALFVGGAVGMEMATAAAYDTTDPLYKENLPYALMAHVEELLEMLGILVFIDFLLRRLGRTAPMALRVAD